MSITIKFCVFKLGTRFRLKLTLLNFWIKITKEGYFWTKKNGNYHRILRIPVNLDSKFQHQHIILIFKTNFQKKVYFQSKIENNEHHYSILHILINLTTYFQPQLQWRFFGPNFPKKGTYFQFKTDKIDTIIEFCIFELILYQISLLSFWKKIKQKKRTSLNPPYSN